MEGRHAQVDPAHQRHRPLRLPFLVPDGRHIVFANSPDTRDAHMRIMTMLADGTEKKALTDRRHRHAQLELEIAFTTNWKTSH